MPPIVCVLAFASLAFTAMPAAAELVFFANGRTMSVKGHRIDGALLVLTLRGGGEVVCEPALVASIGPDEVPYPEPLESIESVATVAPVPIDRTHADPRYEPIIQKVSAEQGMDVKLVRAVIQVESAYQPRARSPRGAIGLMQIMPSTAHQYGVTNLYDPALNIEAGIKHLKSLLNRFPLTLALAAYNAGEVAVERFRGVPPYPETRNYVSRVLQLVGR
jgi:soluble lytic murein transglycosylase-like protein